MMTFVSLRPKLIIDLFVGAALLLSLLGCDALYRLLDKEGAEEKEIIGEALPLEKNPNIEEVQKLLSIYGYDPGSIDGILGRRTRDAVERFQVDNGLKPTRFVDEDTWKKLSIFKVNGFIKEGELNITLLQTVLKDAGFNPGSMDGKFGPKTKEAVITFQKAHDLKADAKVGYKTLSALLRYHKPNQ
jgi:peptidoglycan hydrolase-like protein with peptidoglycan-binding domain